MMKALKIFGIIILAVILVGIQKGCPKSKSSDEKKCKGTHYYELGYKMGKFSRDAGPDQNFQQYGVQYYRLQSGILETDPKAGCYDEGFYDGKDGR